MAIPVAITGAFADDQSVAAVPVSAPRRHRRRHRGRGRHRASRRPRGRQQLPGGGTKVFGHRRFLTAYYGTAGTGVLGVLGETDIDTATSASSRPASPSDARASSCCPSTS